MLLRLLKFQLRVESYLANPIRAYLTELPTKSVRALTDEIEVTVHTAALILYK